MYHLELRQFPHNLCRFNLTDAELRVVTEPWAREQVVELGERKWSPHQARLTILEGPPLPVEQLAMGRGWAAAKRQSEDVTERVLTAMSNPVAGIPAASADLAPLLGHDASQLLTAWRAVVASSPGLAPSESLALAERAFESSSGNPD